MQQPHGLRSGDETNFSTSTTSMLGCKKGSLVEAAGRPVVQFQKEERGDDGFPDLDERLHKGHGQKLVLRAAKATTAHRKTSPANHKVQRAERWRAPTTHPEIPGISVTSRPWLKIGFTVTWKNGASTKHSRSRPRKGHLRRNFRPINTCKHKPTR